MALGKNMSKVKLRFSILEICETRKIKAVRCQGLGADVYKIVVCCEWVLNIRFNIPRLRVSNIRSGGCEELRLKVRNGDLKIEFSNPMQNHEHASRHKKTKTQNS